MPTPLLPVVGADVEVPTLHGLRRYIDMDAGASTNALQSVADAVNAFLPWYASVHRGAGYKSRRATEAYEGARHAALAFAGRDPATHTAILCRNTTDALNHLAYLLRLRPEDVVLTTVIEHHANLLPWGRFASRRFVECDKDGTFSVDDVVAGLEQAPRPRLLAVTGASNVTGWLPPIDEIVRAAHERGVPVVVDSAQVAPHRPLPAEADFVAWSGHKMYAPFGCGVLVGRLDFLGGGDPFLHGGGAVDLVDLDEVVWTDPPERHEAGTPNVIGAVALGAAIDAIGTLGWDTVAAHERALAARLRSGLAQIPGVELLGPGLEVETLAVAAFNIEEAHHSLVAARLSHEHGIGVRHGCFCAHPYLTRLLQLSRTEVENFRAAVLKGDRRRVPGAVRVSLGLGNTEDDVDALLAAVAEIAAAPEPTVHYAQDVATGDYSPATPAGQPTAP